MPLHIYRILFEFDNFEIIVNYNRSLPEYPSSSNLQLFVIYFMDLLCIPVCPLYKQIITNPHPIIFRIHFDIFEIYHFEYSVFHYCMF